MLATVWILVAVLAAANLAYWRWPPRSRLVNDLIIGAACTALVLVVGWMVLMLIRYQLAREGMAIALVIVLCVGGLMRLAISGWRPTLPRLSIPFHAAWPQARYQRRYTSMAAETWEVEEL